MYHNTRNHPPRTPHATNNAKNAPGKPNKPPKCTHTNTTHETQQGSLHAQKAEHNNRTDSTIPHYSNSHADHNHDLRHRTCGWENTYNNTQQATTCTERASKDMNSPQQQNPITIYTILTTNGPDYHNTTYAHRYTAPDTLAVRDERETAPNEPNASTAPETAASVRWPQDELVRRMEHLATHATTEHPHAPSYLWQLPRDDAEDSPHTPTPTVDRPNAHTDTATQATPAQDYPLIPNHIKPKYRRAALDKIIQNLHESHAQPRTIPTHTTPATHALQFPPAAHPDPPQHQPYISRHSASTPDHARALASSEACRWICDIIPPYYTDLGKSRPYL